MHFHLGLGLLLVAAVLHRFLLPVKLAYLSGCGRVVFYIEGNGNFCMINQGISCTELFLNYNESIKLVGFSTEEILSLEDDYQCNGGPLLPCIECVYTCT